MSWEVKTKRPMILTLLCILNYAWVVISFPAIFSPSIKHLNGAVPAILGILVAFHFISTVGIWHMKRWGVEFLIGTFSAKIIFWYLLNDLSVPGIFVSIVTLSFSSWFYKKMDHNL